MKLGNTSNAQSTFNLAGLKVFSGSFAALFFKLSYISKRAGCREKRTEIWESWILVTHIWATFDLVGFKDILGSFWCMCLKMACNVQNGWS